VFSYLSSEHGTCKTGTVRFWPGHAGRSPAIFLSFFLFARNRSGVRGAVPPTGGASHLAGILFNQFFIRPWGLGVGGFLSHAPSLPLFLHPFAASNQAPLSPPPLISATASARSSRYRCRAKRKHRKRFRGFLPESQDQDLVLTILYVPSFLSGRYTVGGISPTPHIGLRRGFVKTPKVNHA